MPGNTSNHSINEQQVPATAAAATIATKRKEDDFTAVA
jgi:hypothetical protein